jgi:hypothetical protein
MLNRYPHHFIDSIIKSGRNNRPSSDKIPRGMVVIPLCQEHNWEIPRYWESNSSIAVSRCDVQIEIITNVFTQLSFFTSSYNTHGWHVSEWNLFHIRSHIYYSVGYTTAMLCVCGNARVYKGLNLPNGIVYIYIYTHTHTHTWPDDGESFSPKHVVHVCVIRRYKKTKLCKDGCNNFNTGNRLNIRTVFKLNIHSLGHWVFTLGIE